jgi:small-conductance mechanosensitive channel
VSQHRVYLVDPPTLLDDLLEDSARVYHRHVAIIQAIFHDQWLAALAQAVGEGQLRAPDAPPAQVEAAARERLRGYRRALAEKAREMMREQQDQRHARDRAIRAYVAAREGAPAVPASLAA